MVVVLYGQKETNFDIGTLHDHYTSMIIESKDGHIWTAGKNMIIRMVDGEADLIPFVEKMDLDPSETDIRGNLYVRGSELFFPLKDKIHAYDIVTESSRVVWVSPDGGEIGYFVSAQDDEGIWIVNFRDDSNEVFYSKDGMSFSEEPIYDLDPFLTGKLFNAEYGLRAHHGRLYVHPHYCLLYTSPSPRDKRQSRMPSSA